MAVHWHIKNKLKKKEFQNTELQKLFFKSILINEHLSEKQKLFAYEQFLKYEKKHSISYYRKYCIINFNGRAVLNQFKIHRLVAKKWANYGFLTGLRKASF